MGAAKPHTPASGTFSKAEVYAAVAALALALPLAALLLGALQDGQQRSQDAPLAALLGMESFARFRGLDPAALHGSSKGLHYLAPDDRSQRLRAPDFTLPDRDGTPWRLRDHQGKVLMLNFWSITCRPCVEEMPSLIDLGRRLQQRDDVELVTISTDKNWEAVQELFKEVEEPPFTILFDPEKQVVKDQFGTRAYPETWFLDGEQAVRLRIDGPRDWSEAVVLDVIDLFR